MTRNFALTIVFLAVWREVTCCSQTNLVLQNNQIYVFSSKNYPNPYPSTTHTCLFEATAQVGKKIYVKCDVFDVLYDSQCYYARFYFSPSGDPTYADGSVYCGYYSSLSLQTNSNKIALRFDNYWYNSNGQKGFRCYVATWPIGTTPTTQPPSICECGRKNGASRIVGGQETAISEYPWMAGLLFVGDEEPYCGGSLINHRWVLTTSHCVEPFLDQAIEVVLGAHELGPTIQSGKRIQVSQKIIHENYEKQTVDNDIALLKLAEHVYYTSAISPVCLPFKFANPNFEGWMGTIAGWGTLSYQGNTPKVLHDVDLPIINTETCRSYHASTTVLTDNMFCTLQNGKDACQGDSGGPLTITFGGRRYEVGLVSWGIGCATQDKPGVYAKVSNYLQWIETKTGVSFCKV
ncbi:CUB domain [Trinorchestia longiramus]|nr:CUB domain [Trinorchestia longiramus]